MGAAGHIWAMQQRLKANRNALRSRRNKTKNNVAEFPERKALRIKKVDGYQLEKVKRKIQEKLKKRRSNQRTVFFIIITFILCFFIMIGMQ